MNNLKSLTVLFVTKEMIDSLYRYLKTQYVHFSIVILDEQDIEFYSKNADLNIYYIHDMSNINAHDTNRKSGVLYPYVIIMTPLNILNLPSILKAEKKIHSIIPAKYKYTLSLHSVEYEYRKFPIYLIQRKSQPNQKEKLIINNTKGYGNSIIDMPVMQKFCSINEQMGYLITIWHTYSESLNISNIFLSDAVHKVNPYIDTGNIGDILSHDLCAQYSEIINMDNLILRSSHTKFDDLCNFFHIGNSKSLLDNLQINEVPLEPELIAQIMNLKSAYRSCIGVHFQTHDDAVCANRRSWSKKNVAEFIDRCHRENICVINLAPYNDTAVSFDIDCGSLPFKILFSLYKYIDVFVGIESSCAHIAGILKKENLLILGKAIEHVSQRPLSFNHTIISKSGDIDDIQPDTVFGNLNKLLSDQIPVSSYTNKIYEFHIKDKTITIV